jgi:hypothetical protein
MKTHAGRDVRIARSVVCSAVTQDVRHIIYHILNAFSSEAHTASLVTARQKNDKKNLFLFFLLPHSLRTACI